LFAAPRSDAQNSVLTLLTKWVPWRRQGLPHEWLHEFPRRYRALVVLRYVWVKLTMSESQKELLLMVDGTAELGRKKIIVQRDSQLLITQLNGEYRVKDEKLKILYSRALALLRQFDS
jgi:hypothetical protein